MPKVLMFHRVLPEKLISSPNAYSTFGTLISQEYLEIILSFLRINDYKFVNVSQISKFRNSEKVIALTFDDGYSDNFEYAFPTLKKFKTTATFFPVVRPCMEGSVLPLDIYYQCVDDKELSESERTEFISGATKRNFYWTDPNMQNELLKDLFNELPKNNNLSYMSAKQLKLLSDSSFEIGSHGMSHSLMIADYMNEDKALNELQSSKQWLEKITGKPVTSYCFPAGRYNSRMIDLAKQVGYTSTCLVVRNEREKEALPCYDRIFVKPNSLEELKTALNLR